MRSAGTNAENLARKKSIPFEENFLSMLGKIPEHMRKIS